LSGIFNEIIIVSNSPREFSHHRDHKIVPDIFKGIGPLGGIHAALKASSSDAVFVVAGDMPLISRGILLNQIELFRQRHPDVLIPRIGDYIEPLHSIYSRSVISELENHIQNNISKAVWKFIKNTWVEYFEPEDEADAIISFMSINSPNEADSIEKIIRNRS